MSDDPRSSVSPGSGIDADRKVGGATRRRRDALLVGGLALLTRLAMVAYAAPRFPASEDGRYYDKLAGRLAEGAGYTWLWPDGVVTFAAHYPVGYPALLAAAYRLLGHHVAVAMALNAVIGAVGVVALWAATRGAFGRRAGLLAGGLLALHPALLLYTPAVMTEGITAALLSVSVYLAYRAQIASRRSPRGLLVWCAALGLSVGLATLVRPQSVLVAPVLGWLVAASTARGVSGVTEADEAGGERRASALAGGFVRKLGVAVFTLATALAVCAPWTARNCVRMKQCALVSVNGGWNLLIGAARGAESTGHWMPIDVPDECKTVWDEAGKDKCFGAAARRVIARDPLTFLSLVPRKLAATFDYCGAGPWYLHAAAPERFSDSEKLRAGVIETVFNRLTLLAALVAAIALSWRRNVLGPATRVAIGVVAVTGTAFLVQTHAAWSFVALLVLLALALAGPPRERSRTPAVVGGAFAVLLTTAFVHAVFFGAGRYSLVVLPFVASMGAAALTLVRRARDTG